MKREGKRAARLNAKLMSKSRKNNNRMNINIDKHSGSNVDCNTPIRIGGGNNKGINDGTKTEKSDADDMMCENNNVPGGLLLQQQ